MCWCVTPHGDQVPGSLTRGAPQCQGSARAARRMSFDPATPTNMSKCFCYCEYGWLLHKHVEFISELISLTCEERIRSMKIPALKEGRERDLINIYRMVNGMENA